MKKNLQESVKMMCGAIEEILGPSNSSIMLFGSVVCDDFQFGWSDIDFLCLAKDKLTDNQAQKLLHLRQELKEKLDNPLFRLFEGGILSETGFLLKEPDKVVYWGTSGERITSSFTLCPFSTLQLISNGQLVLGKDFREKLIHPSETELIEAIKAHLETIRRYASATKDSLYTCGWMADIARCLYTLKTSKILSKTQALKWAIDEKLYSHSDILKRVLEIRENPSLHEKDGTKLWILSLNPHIQSFADVLTRELNREQTES